MLRLGRHGHCRGIVCPSRALSAIQPKQPDTAEKRMKLRSGNRGKRLAHLPTDDGESAGPAEDFAASRYRLTYDETREGHAQEARSGFNENVK